MPDPALTIRVELTLSPALEALAHRFAAALSGASLAQPVLPEQTEPEPAPVGLEPPSVRMKAVAIWTDERDALGRKLRDAGWFDRDIVAEVNKLPGYPVRNVNVLQKHAATACWPRSKHWTGSTEQQVWTDARNAEGRRLRASGATYPEMLAALNAMPGHPIASLKALRNHAGTERWPGPSKATSADPLPAATPDAPGHTDLMVSPEAIDDFLAANPLPPLEPEPEEQFVPAPEPEIMVWTRERDDEGRRMRAEGARWPDIFEALNKMPGMAISSPAAVTARAYARGWPRPPVPRVEPEPLAVEPEPTEPVKPEPPEEDEPEAVAEAPGVPAVAVQAPIRPPISALPAGRDGLPSVAAALERDQDRRMQWNPVDWQTVREWAGRNKLVGMPERYDMKALQRVNKLRATHLLPPFHVVRA